MNGDEVHARTLVGRMDVVVDCELEYHISEGPRSSVGSMGTEYVSGPYLTFYRIAQYCECIIHL